MHAFVASLPEYTKMGIIHAMYSVGVMVFTRSPASPAGLASTCPMADRFAKIGQHPPEKTKDLQSSVSHYRQMFWFHAIHLMVKFVPRTSAWRCWQTDVLAVRLPALLPSH